MAALQQTSLFQRSWMLLSCCSWRLRPCCDILTSSCSPSPGSSVAWQALQSGSVHDTKRKPCHSIRFLPGHGELQLREGALGDSHCDANWRRWWEYFFLQFSTFISAPNLEQATAGFCNEDNLTGIREYGAAWASGDMERLQAVLAPDFTLTVEGEDCAVARDDLPTFYANSREQATS